MKYQYSVVRFVPDTVRGEFVNIGVIVGSDESSEWEVRTVENQRRARQLDDKGLLRQVWNYLDDIGRKFDQFSEAVQDSLFDTTVEPVSEGWLGRLALEAGNVVQFSQPAVIVADSPAEALDTLFEQFIVEPASRRFAFQKKHAALAAIRKAYRAAGLAQRQHYEEGANVMGSHHRERFDFVVANGRAVQLAQTWSFQVPNQVELAEQVKAWAWTVRDVRANGGFAQTSTRRLEVPRDVDIEVVYVPPTVDGARETLDEALAAFKEVDVHWSPAEGAVDIGRTARMLVEGSAH